MKRRIFLVCLFYCFLDCRSANLLRLFSGNLPAMFLIDLKLILYFNPVSLQFNFCKTEFSSYKRILVNFVFSYEVINLLRSYLLAFLVFQAGNSVTFSPKITSALTLFLIQDQRRSLMKPFLNEFVQKLSTHL